MSHSRNALLLVVAAMPMVCQAQYYNGYYGNSGVSYGERIGIGVGIAVAVAIAVLLAGWIMRRRRARAFKAAYPVQPGPQPVQNQQQQSNYGPQYGSGNNVPMQSYPPQGWQQGSQMEQGQAPPGYANYRQDSSSQMPQQHYAPPQSAPPGQDQHQQPHYNPPTSPPPAANTSTAYYAPPSGAPPTNVQHINK